MSLFETYSITLTCHTGCGSAPVTRVQTVSTARDATTIFTDLGRGAGVTYTARRADTGVVVESTGFTLIGDTVYALSCL